MDEEVLEIVERLASVETSMQRYRAALMAVGLIAAAGIAGPSLVGAAKAPAEVQARTFTVVDDNGVVRAVLGARGDEVALALNDKAGIRRITLGVIGNDTSLVLADNARNTRAALGTNDDEPSLILTDEAGKKRVGLTVMRDLAGLRVFDKTGNNRAALEAGGDNTLLVLHDKNAKVRAALGNFDLENKATGAATEHRTSSSLVLLNEQGRVLWEAPKTR